MKSKKAVRTPADLSPAAVQTYVLEEQIGFQLRVVMQRHTAIFASAMVGGLTQTQFATMAKLRDAGSSPQTHLAQLVALDAATLNGVLERLRLRGLVQIDLDPNDGRRRLATLTPRGLSLLEQSLDVARQITVDTLAPLSESERRTLSRLLKKLA